MFINTPAAVIGLGIQNYTARIRSKFERLCATQGALPRKPRRDYRIEAARLEAGYHEAGHIVAARAFGWPVVGVEIDKDNAGASTWFRIYGSHADNRHDLIVMSLAGPLAVARRLNRPYRFGSDAANRQDEADIEKLCGRSCQNLYSFMAAQSEAERFVNKHWPVIRKLAAEIFRHRVMDGDQLSKFFRSN